MVKLVFIGFFAFVAMGFMACNTMTDTSKQDSKVDALIDKDWRLTSWQYDPGLNISGVIVIDNYTLLAPCVTDGYTRFLSDGTFYDDEGPTKCDETNNQFNSGKWSLNKNQTVLTKTYDDGSSQEFAVEMLNDNHLVISMLDSNLRYEEVYKVTLGYSAE